MTRKLHWLVPFLALAATMVAGTASATAAPTVQLDGVRTTLWTDPATTKVLLSNKIVPLLAWTARFSGTSSTPGAPTVADLFSARVARVQLAIMVVAIVLLAAAVMIGVATAAYGGASLFLIGVLLFVSQIGRVALGGRRRHVGDKA